MPYRLVVYVKKDHEMPESKDNPLLWKYVRRSNGDIYEYETRDKAKKYSMYQYIVVDYGSENDPAFYNEENEGDR